MKKEVLSIDIQRDISKDYQDYFFMLADYYRDLKVQATQNNHKIIEEVANEIYNSLLDLQNKIHVLRNSHKFGK